MLDPIGPLPVATPLVHCPWPRPWLSVPSASPVCGAQLPGDAGRVGLHGERARRSARPPPRPAPRRPAATVRARPSASRLPSAFSAPFSSPGANSPHLTSSPGRTHLPRP